LRAAHHDQPEGLQGRGYLGITPFDPGGPPKILAITIPLPPYPGPRQWQSVGFSLSSQVLKITAR
jgi:hypothetical protein